MTNPFKRAEKHGAPDMRVTPPPSAETPMQPPPELETALAHRTRQRDEEIDRNFKIGTRMIELQAINAELLAALERALQSVCKCGSSDCYETNVRRQANAAIAKARGE